MTSRKSKATKALTPTCACCGRPMTRPGTQFTGIGIVGPECEKKVSAHLPYLMTLGLGDLFLQGEVRLAAQPTENGGWSYPAAEINAWREKAAKVGFDLLARKEKVEGGWDIVMTLEPRSVRRWFGLQRGWHATAEAV